MWQSCVHFLKPLTDHSGLKNHAPIPWTLVIQTAFNKMSVLMVADILYKKANQSCTFPISCQMKLYADGKGNAIHCSYTQ
ncbi:LOW QUALITY PROTEIN: hypothetical protein ACHAW6_004331 [Cyclotella cf. meneghiniana]